MRGNESGPGVAILTLIAVLTTACGTSAPVTPTTPTPRTLTTRRLSGVVRDDDDQPVPSAQVHVISEMIVYVDRYFQGSPSVGSVFGAIRVGDVPHRVEAR